MNLTQGQYYSRQNLLAKQQNIHNRAQKIEKDGKRKQWSVRSPEIYKSLNLNEEWSYLKIRNQRLGAPGWLIWLRICHWLRS